MENIPQPVTITICTVAGILVFILLLIYFVLLPRSFQNAKNKKELASKLLKHAIITGGSSGIGLSIAQELVRKRCKTITLLARNIERLNDAKAKLESQAVAMNNTDTEIHVHSVDICNSDSVAKVSKEICGEDERNKLTAPTMLFNVAGLSVTGKFIDTDVKEFERCMQCNYLGTVNVTHAFLPYMIAQGNDAKEPKIVIFTSSAAGQVGIFGYTAYSPSKFALLGLAEALQMEIMRDNIFVQVVYPPDTDTPMYQEERVGIPEETELIAATAGLFQPNDVAKKMVSSALQHRPSFCVYFGLEGWMLNTLTAGMSPVHSIVDAMCQIFLMGLLRFISLFYLMDFRRIIYKVGNSNSSGKEKKE